MLNLHKFKMAAFVMDFAYISRPETRRSLILVSIPMFSWSMNTIIAVSNTWNNWFRPNLHKFKMAAFVMNFAYISRPETRRSLILVSIPMFSWSMNTIIAVSNTWNNWFRPNLHKFKMAAILMDFCPYLEI